ncbi:helix-turn-helix domain-containing protein [Streptomyces sp. CBMA152]|uniref:helix-turn-helix domain-containing protein n=1 Tax=Streptomyces sp. CBMA152 TaxID=1896312 RepID=UPI001660B548|nr:helix-turn-helix domain-containing protein [Streptomyces sp. CBMA152]MBD0743549.1 hypothetical protein [Streptomyces sp. CBMA152]
MLSVKEVAELLDVHPATIYRWINGGHLRALRHGKPYEPGTGTAVGGAFRIPESEVGCHTDDSKAVA